MLRLSGMVAGIDGDPMYRDDVAGDPRTGARLGTELADRILDRGARGLLEALYALEERGRFPPRDGH